MKDLPDRKSDSRTIDFQNKTSCIDSSSSAQQCRKYQPKKDLKRTNIDELVESSCYSAERFSVFQLVVLVFWPASLMFKGSDKFTVKAYMGDFLEWGFKTKTTFPNKHFSTVSEIIY